MAIPYKKGKGDPVFLMQAHSRSFITLNVTAIVIGAIIILALLFVRMLFHPMLFMFVIIILIAYMVVDYLVWVQRGIRRIEIYDDRIMIYRGSSERSESISASTITDVNVFSKLNRHVVNIMCGGKVDKALPGVTLFSGPRVRVTDDAFDTEEFKQFVTHLQNLQLKTWSKKQQGNPGEYWNDST